MRSQQQVEAKFLDYSGGYAGAKSPGTLEANQAADLDNIVLNSGSTGFVSRNGNTAFTTALNSTHQGQGIGYYPFSGSDYLIAVVGGKIFRVTSAAAATDVTGTLSITSGRYNSWQFHRLNSVAIGLGVDAPFKVTATGNASALGGSPPTGAAGFVYNGRMFILSSSSAYWSVLSNPEDWSSTGSGSVALDSGDGETLTAGVVLNDDNALIFKKNKTFRLLGRSSPFPTTLLFDKVGCVGPNAAIAVDGLAYWLAAPGRFCISDGTKIYDENDVPALANADDLFDGIDQTYLQYAKMTRLQTPHFDWIVISVTTPATVGKNGLAIIWDIQHRCFLKCSTGFESNGYAIAGDGTLYMMGYDGIIYKHNVTGTTTDASNAAATVSWYWDTDWLSSGSMLDITKVNWFNLAYMRSTTGTIAVYWAKDGQGFNKSSSFSLVGTDGFVLGTSLLGTGRLGGQVRSAIKNVPITSRGNVMKFRIAGANSVINTINGHSVVGTKHAQKHFTAS
jgi:hypothetical protein